MLPCALTCAFTYSHFPTLYTLQYKLRYIYCQRGTGNRQSALLHNGRGSCIGIAIFTREESSDLFLDKRGVEKNDSGNF